MKPVRIDATTYYTLLDQELANYHGFTIDPTTFDPEKLVMFRVTFDRENDPTKEGVLKAIQHMGLASEQLALVNLDQIPILYHCEFFNDWLKNPSNADEPFDDRLDLFTKTGKRAFGREGVYPNPVALCVFYDDGVSRFYYAIAPSSKENDVENVKCPHKRNPYLHVKYLISTKIWTNNRWLLGAKLHVDYYFDLVKREVVFTNDPLTIGGGLITVVKEPYPVNWFTPEQRAHAVESLEHIHTGYLPIDLGESYNNDFLPINEPVAQGTIPQVALVTQRKDQPMIEWYSKYKWGYEALATDPGGGLYYPDKYTLVANGDDLTHISPYKELFASAYIEGHNSTGVDAEHPVTIEANFRFVSSAPYSQGFWGLHSINYMPNTTIPISRGQVDNEFIAVSHGQVALEEASVTVKYVRCVNREFKEDIHIGTMTAHRLEKPNGGYYAASTGHLGSAQFEAHRGIVLDKVFNITLIKFITNHEGPPKIGSFSSLHPMNIEQGDHRITSIRAFAHVRTVEGLAAGTILPDQIPEPINVTDLPETADDVALQDAIEAFYDQTMVSAGTIGARFPSAERTLLLTVKNVEVM